MTNENSHKRWRVLLLDTKRSNPNHYLCLGLHQALRSHPQVETVVSSSLGEALSRAREGRCNLFIAFDGEELMVCAREGELGPLAEEFRASLEQNKPLSEKLQVSQDESKALKNEFASLQTRYEETTRSELGAYEDDAKRQQRNLGLRLQAVLAENGLMRERLHYIQEEMRSVQDENGVMRERLRSVQDENGVMRERLRSTLAENELLRVAHDRYVRLRNYIPQWVRSLFTRTARIIRGRVS